MKKQNTIIPVLIKQAKQEYKCLVQSQLLGQISFPKLKHLMIRIDRLRKTDTCISEQYNGIINLQLTDQRIWIPQNCTVYRDPKNTQEKITAFGASDYFHISVSKKVTDNQASKKQDRMNKNQQKQQKTNTGPGELQVVGLADNRP